MVKLSYIILILTALAYGQFKEKDDYDPREVLLKSEKSSPNSFNDRLKIDHTYSMSYQSNSKASMMTGLYVAGFNYLLADPLLLKVEIGAGFVPYTSFSAPSDQKGDIFLKSASLDYRPNDSFRLMIEVNQAPTSELLRREEFENYTNPFRHYNLIK